MTVAPEVAATIPGFDDELLAVLETRKSRSRTPWPTAGRRLLRELRRARTGMGHRGPAGRRHRGRTGPAVLGRRRRRRVDRDRRSGVSVRRRGVSAVQRRSREVGQLMKLDPRRPDDPLIWSIDAREIGFGCGRQLVDPGALRRRRVLLDGGWASARGRSRHGDRAARAAGRGSSIASPVVVDGVLILGTASATCTRGTSPIRRSSRRCCGRCGSRGASNRRLRCGEVALQAHARGTCTASPTPTGRGSLAPAPEERGEVGSVLRRLAKAASARAPTVRAPKPATAIAVRVEREPIPPR